MTVDPAVIPGFLLLLAELAALAAVGYVVARVALRQADDRVALAQGLVVGPALWGLITNFVLYAVPGLAGAAVGWGIVLILGAVLVWRAPRPLRPPPRVAAGFLVTALVVFWVALASRQLLSVSDPQTQLGQAATIRMGGFPPGLPWSPGIAEHYHYGSSLLAGLLAPPFGPDLAFVWELLGAFTWTSFALIVVSALRQRSSGLAVLLTLPLWLTTGAWTFIVEPGAIVRLPIPAGIPAAGLRASLTDIYWPEATYAAVLDMRYAALPNIWNHSFPMAYALVVVVLQQAARAECRSWGAAVTLAGLVGFTGLISMTIAPVLFVMWAGLQAAVLVQLSRTGTALQGAALRSGVGLALAAILLVVGGRLIGILAGSAPSGLQLASNLEQTHWQALGKFEARPGGLGLLGAGPLAIACVAFVLARRDRLVVTLAAGAGLLALIWVVLNYPPSSLGHRPHGGACPQSGVGGTAVGAQCSII